MEATLVEPPKKKVRPAIPLAERFGSWECTTQISTGNMVYGCKKNGRASEIVLRVINEPMHPNIFILHRTLWSYLQLVNNAYRGGNTHVRLHLCSRTDIFEGACRHDGEDLLASLSAWVV